MSWWKSSNLTSFASQALKTAQKSIDKVLDIGEDSSSPSGSSPSDATPESPKSPPAGKSNADGDNFWSTWLGDGGPEGENKESEVIEDEKDTASISKMFTSGFKSERAKSKVEQVILSRSVTSKSEEVTESVETQETSATESSGSLSSLAKKSSPLRLTAKVGTRKSEEKGKEGKERTSVSEETENADKTENVASISVPVSSTSATLTVSSQYENVTSTVIATSSESDTKIDSTASSALAIADMVSSVSDGWTVEGWATDGQLEDLLQTSMIQNMEDDGEEVTESESGLTRKLSSSSGVTVQNLEPSLVVADSEDEPKLEVAESQTAEESDADVKPQSESKEEPEVLSSTDDSPLDHREEESNEKSVDLPRGKTDETVPAEVPTVNEDLVIDEIEEEIEWGEESEENASSDVPKIEEPFPVPPDSTESQGVSINEESAEEVETNEEPFKEDESKPETAVERSEIEGDLGIESPENITEKDASEHPTEAVSSQPVEESTGFNMETAAENSGKDETENDSKGWESDPLEERESGAIDQVVESVIDAQESGDQEGAVVEADRNDLAQALEMKAAAELQSEENDLSEGDQEKKASEWVVEMCQLKDSITSTTASDELSDSNRTITSEDVGELSIEVSDAALPEPEGETESIGDLQREQQMTLRVASGSDMVSSTVSSSSSIVRNLEDAMSESLKDNDSHSTTSTEKSSEMVRIESGLNSGHTSGDEIETTTSSDIEIISTTNSNGDYKLERPFEFSPLRYALSRTVRHSPPGHKRSDSSSSGHSNWSKNGDDMLSPEGGIHILEEQWPKVPEEDDPSGNPVGSERLLKRLADMAEVLEAREKKLMEMSRENIDLQEANSILRQQLQQSEEAREVEMSDLTTLTEEFTKRLSEAEKKFNSLARERDALKRQLKDTETILAKRSDNSVAVEKLLKEKDLQISELLAEGEKLSKQQLQSNNIIKKLRNKEKENETLIKSQTQKIDNEGAELEHLRKVLDVKEDLEKKQIEAINQLNNLVKKQEVEILKYKSDAEDHQEKIRSMQVTVDNSYKEIAGLHKKSATKASEAQEARLSVELAAKEELRLSLERSQLQARQHNEALISQIEDLRLSLTRMEKEHCRKEDILRQEISDLQQRLQEAEDRNQELTEGVSSATRPLLRQIENLQSTHGAQLSSFERIERNLTERLADAQEQLANAQEKERSASEKFLDISTRIKSLESQVSILRQEKSVLSAQLEMERAKVETLEDTRHSDITHSEAARISLEKDLTEVKKQQVLLENQLEMEKMKVESEKKKLQLAHDTIKEKELELQLQQSLRVSPEVSLMTRSSHASLSRESSFHEAMSQSMVLPDDGVEKSFLMVSPNGNKMSLYETLRQTGASTLIENLQSQLKLREGEISQLQSDIAELEKTRESMARELVNESNEKETLASQVTEFAELKTKFTELDNRYNALLMMYGEKVEEAEELTLDLQDVKDMYKAQIEELVNKR